MKCDICSKSGQFGHNVSHSKRHTAHRWLANTHPAKVTCNGTTMRMNLCTRCMRNQRKYATTAIKIKTPGHANKSGETKEGHFIWATTKNVRSAAAQAPRWDYAVVFGCAFCLHFHSCIGRLAPPRFCNAVEAFSLGMDYFRLRQDA